MTDSTDQLGIDLARECLYRFFAVALSDPRTRTGSDLAVPENRELVLAAAELLRTEAGFDPIPLGFGERPADELNLVAALNALVRPQAERIADFDRIFGLVTFRECPPYETEYCATEDPFFRAQQLADAAGFYAAFGLTVGRATPDRADHITRELEFMAHLLLMQRRAIDLDRATVCADASRRFFRDHLAWWAPSFASGLRRRAEGTGYEPIAVALAAFLPVERSRLDVPTPQAPVRPRGMPVPVEEDEGCASCAVGA